MSTNRDGLNFDNTFHSESSIRWWVLHIFQFETNSIKFEVSYQLTASATK